MKILSLDTSAAACSVGVTINGLSIVARSEEMMRGQSERLIPLIQETLASASLKPVDLNAVATTVGPGAFTGIRIGLASVRALGLALGIPMIGFTTTHVIAMGQKNLKKHPVLVAIETKRADIYIDIFQANGVSKIGPKAVRLDQVVRRIKDKDILLCGDGAQRLKPLLENAGIGFYTEDISSLPDPVVIGRLGADEISKHGIAHFMQPPQPLYIRPPDASLPKPNPRSAK